MGVPRAVSANPGRLLPQPHPGSHSLAIHAPLVLGERSRCGRDPAGFFLGHFLSDWTTWKFASVLALHVRAGGVSSARSRSPPPHATTPSSEKPPKPPFRWFNEGKALARPSKASPACPNLSSEPSPSENRPVVSTRNQRRAVEIFKRQTLGMVDAFAEWAPRILYFLIVLFTAWRILAMASDFANSINSSLNIET